MPYANPNTLFCLPNGRPAILREYVQPVAPMHGGSLLYLMVDLVPARRCPKGKQYTRIGITQFGLN